MQIYPMPCCISFLHYLPSPRSVESCLCHKIFPTASELKVSHRLSTFTFQHSPFNINFVETASLVLCVNKFSPTRLLAVFTIQRTPSVVCCQLTLYTVLILKRLLAVFLPVLPTRHMYPVVEAILRFEDQLVIVGMFFKEVEPSVGYLHIGMLLAVLP